ncbi:S1C family serine protease [Paraburkholderia unamae]|uniref:S1-C subfamily serine protease n=1 Tax=Paraburkholderia unamae TaxID=219649 RepID=A0ABX5KEX5_9BURK|nr:trypsin-like peptidase domain-containing protein [Paraburkholderia unamae]PVX76413.1 S1-C subfamily serine protease [Paraburkholderia unamae]CAG9257054.1 Serine protease Do [Paraburkholderia unamae]
MSTNKYRRRGLIAGVALAVAGTWVVTHGHASADESSKLKTTVSAPMPKADNATGQAPNFSAIVAKYGPAVVHIEVVKENPESESGHSGALGSGFIVSQDGYILTNNHVVEDADAVTVKLTDGRTLRARVIGTDKAGDVAVLKIPGSGFPTVKIGDPASSKVGDWVVAIGSPYGLDNTVTSGIISAKSRQLSEDSPTHLIQTDVPVNPGNSGGPLFNLNGEVIGINSMIYSRTGGFQGLSFAIPIDEAMQMKEQIVQGGNQGYASNTPRPRLGVAVRQLTGDEAQQIGVDGGVLVMRAAGPARAAGISAGDVIVAVNGVKVRNVGQLQKMIAQADDAVSIVVNRDGERMIAQVDLAQG